MRYKIGIDFTYIMDSSITGIRKYGEEIVEGLEKLRYKDYDIILFVIKSLELQFRNKFPKYRIVSIPFYFEDIRYVRRLNAFNITKRIIMNREKCDLIIYPYVCNYTKVLKNTEKIIAILDIIPLDMIKDKNSISYNRVKHKYFTLMNKTKYITTLSEYSKKKLEAINPNYNGEIMVIPSPVEVPINNKKRIIQGIELDKPYILSINSFLKHKNQITLVKAFNHLKNTIPHILVLVRKTRNKWTK